MEKQEFVALVEQAIEKLKVQGKPSKLSDGSCKYQGPVDTCCIIGHMMPTDQVRLKADSYKESSVKSLKNFGFSWFDQFNPKQMRLLSTLQEIHDEMPNLCTVQDIDQATNEMKVHLDSYKNTDN